MAHGCYSVVDPRLYEQLPQKMKPFARSSFQVLVACHPACPSLPFRDSTSPDSCHVQGMNACFLQSYLCLVALHTWLCIACQYTFWLETAWFGFVFASHENASIDLGLDGGIVLDPFWVTILFPRWSR